MGRRVAGDASELHGSRACGRRWREGRVRIAVADVAVALAGLTGHSVNARLVMHTCRFIAAGGRLLAAALAPRMTTGEGVWALGL